MLIPIGNRILVEAEEPEDSSMTEGGIVIPDYLQKKEKYTSGIIKHRGTGVTEPELVEGARVLFHTNTWDKFAGLTMLSQGDIIGVEK